MLFHYTWQLMNKWSTHNFPGRDLSYNSYYRYSPTYAIFTFHKIRRQCKRLHIYICAFIYAYIYIYMRTPVYICMCMCIYIYIHTYIQIYMYAYSREPSRNPNSSTLELDRPQHDRSSTCVIAQQYSSITFVFLRFHSLKEDLCARYFSICFSPFQNCVRFKYGNLKLSKSVSIWSKVKVRSTLELATKA